MLSSSNNNENNNTESKTQNLFKKLLPDSSTFAALSDHSKFVSRCCITGMFYGMLLGAGTPASPIFYKTFQSDVAAQFNIIFTFTTIGFFASAVPYGLFLDGVKRRERYLAKKQQIHHHNTSVTKSASSSSSLSSSSSVSSSVMPQFKNIFEPMYLGFSCWLAGHLYYPGRFVFEFEARGNRVREFVRLTTKTALALHKIHLPFALGWSLFFGIMMKPWRLKYINDGDNDGTTKYDENVVVIDFGRKEEEPKMEMKK